MPAQGIAPVRYAAPIEVQCTGRARQGLRLAPDIQRQAGGVGSGNGGVRLGKGWCRIPEAARAPANDFVHRVDASPERPVPSACTPDRCRCPVAAIAIVGSLPALIVEAEAILAAAGGTRAVAVLQKLRIDAEPGEDFTPPAARALDRVHGHSRFPFPSRRPTAGLCRRCWCEAARAARARRRRCFSGYRSGTGRPSGTAGRRQLLPFLQAWPGSADAVHREKVLAGDLPAHLLRPVL